MNIVERGRALLQSLRELAGRSVWDWRRCPHCGDTLTCKWGSYQRQPWGFTGRQQVQVQRHRCERCRQTYSETSPLLVRGSWYAREVHRAAIDHWQHAGTSVRRTGELLRSWMGHQERWELWRPLDPAPPEGKQCHLGASTVHRWLDRAGQAAQGAVPGYLAGILTCGQMGTDGLWARLRRGATGVVLGLVDYGSGLVWPPVVTGDEGESAWERMFRRAVQAGLQGDALRGLTSDGAGGLAAYLDRALTWVNHQRCVWHLWRGLGGEFARQGSQAAAGYVGAAAKAVAGRTRRDLAALVRAVLNAPSEAAAQVALAALALHPRGSGLAQGVREHLDAALVHLLLYHRGLSRVAPEWLWRDFRLRLSHGRNHGSHVRLERAALVWATYHNFQPAQRRSEGKRRYRRAGRSPLEMAGVPPGGISYLDALEV